MKKDLPMKQRFMLISVPHLERYWQMKRLKMEFPKRGDIPLPVEEHLVVELRFLPPADIIDGYQRPITVLHLLSDPIL